MSATNSTASPAKPANWAQMTPQQRYHWYNDQPYRDTPKSRWEAQRAASVPKPVAPVSPFVERAGKARDLLVAAGMGVQVRIITFDAGKFAGDDHQKYLAYVQAKIDAHKAKQAADSWLDDLARECATINRELAAQGLRRVSFLDGEEGRPVMTSCGLVWATAQS